MLKKPSIADLNPHPQLPVLIIIPRHSEAERMQRSLNPHEFIVMGLHGPLTGLRFRMVQVCISGWEDQMRHRFSESEVRSVDDFLRHARTKLGPGCEQHFYRL